MKNKFDIRSEDGAAYVLEAIIIFPLVFLVVIFLVFVGFTYVQQGFLNYHSSEMAAYLAKNICYPGYDYIDEPIYDSGKGKEVTLDNMNKAANAGAPYRYLFGLFGSEYKSAEDNNGDIMPQYAKHMAETYLQNHGFLKSSGGSVDLPSGVKFDKNRTFSSNGYICAVSANTSRVVVYMAQNFVFADFFRMIGIGGKKMVISSQSTSYVTDSLEIVKLTDMAFDVTNFVLGKLGIDTSKLDKIGEMIKKVTNN